MIIPDKGQWIQRNRGDAIGNLLGSFNVDLTSLLGKARPTRMIQTTTQTTNTNLTGNPVGFKVFNDGSATKIWTVAGSKVHASASAVPNSPFIVDATTGTPVDCDSTLSDIEVFGSMLCVTANSKLYVRTTGSWSNTSFSGSGPWMMAVFAGRLYFTVAGSSKIFSTIDGTTIISPSGTPNVNAYSFALDTNQRPSCIVAASNRLWVGTIATSGVGYVYEFANGATTYTTNYVLKSQGVVSMTIENDIPVITDTNGKVLRFSNGTFDEIGRFPLNDELLLSAANSINSRFMHPNGMALVNGKINFALNNALDNTSLNVPEFCPSGIWEYDEIIYDPYTGTSVGSGLYHKYSFSYTPQGSNTITDYGQNMISGIGGISEMKVTNNSASATGNLLAGATIFTNALTTNVGVFTNDTFKIVSGAVGQIATQGLGYFVTTQITAKQIKDNWGKSYAFYRKFLTASDFLSIKYRFVKFDPIYITITWLNATTFTTTTTDLQPYINYEVEILQGIGAGNCVHITDAHYINSTTISVTIDQSLTGVTTGTAKARISNWIKAGTILNTDDHGAVNIDKTTSWIQLKICCYMTGLSEFIKLFLLNSSNE